MDNYKTTSELSARLREAFESADGKAGGSRWFAVAEEAVRCMEWARSNCVESVDSFEAGNSWLVNKPLTVAPDDWKAE